MIGGTLEIKDGANISGFPICESQSESTASTIAELKSDFNALILKLKQAGLMKQDST